jgi:dihydroneopterin aldolase
VLLDLELVFSFPEEDRLEETVDYSKVVELVKGLGKEEFLLLETLARRAARLILDSFPSLEAVRVRAHKPEAPLPVGFQDLYAECFLER